MTASTPPLWLTQFLTDSGGTAAGAKLYSYIAGTSTPAPLFSDPEGITALANPAIADAAGRLEYYLSDQIVYKLALKTSTGITIAEIPEVSGSAPADALSVISAGYRSQAVVSGSTPIIIERTLLTSVDTSQVIEANIQVPASTDIVSLGIVDRLISPGPETLFTIPLNSSGDSADVYLRIAVEHRLIGASRTCSYGVTLTGAGGYSVKSYASGLPWRSASGDIAIGLSTPAVTSIPVLIWCSTIREMRHD
ncbi:hypothetical protein UFOVP602_46 [uncultured Caudovirales phage]|uniref:Uncharacterized protein n=1 Tax=uncultured Caudovirales phage TaxID=2100421 RepID=A0A6J5N3C9_9CAUD|nr:hypothetical protein UFOVP602_46 [uncultured Caudovirales phage]